MQPLSPSALGKFKDCPRCFYIEKNLKVKAYRGIMASIPNAIDDALKEYHDQHRHRGLLPPEVAAQVPDGVPYPDLLKLMGWRQLGKGIRAVVDGVPLLGLLDDLMMFTDGTAASYDYKSNKEPRTPDYAARYYQHQGDLYTLLLGENGFKTRPRSFWSFWSPKPIVGSGDAATRTIQFPFDCTVHNIEASATRARDLVKAAVKCLEQKTMPEPGDDCEMCKYVLIRAKGMKGFNDAAKAAKAALDAQGAAA